MLHLLLHSPFRMHSTLQTLKISGCTSATLSYQTGSTVVPNPDSISRSQCSWMTVFVQLQLEVAESHIPATEFCSGGEAEGSR